MAGNDEFRLELFDFGEAVQPVRGIDVVGVHERNAAVLHNVAGKQHAVGLDHHHQVARRMRGAGIDQHEALAAEIERHPLSKVISGGTTRVLASTHGESASRR